MATERIAWDKTNKCYVGKLSLGFNGDGKTRNRPSVRGKTKAEVKDKLDKLRAEINAGIRTPATYTIEQCVKDWLDSIERDPHTMATMARPGQELDLSEDRHDQAQGVHSDRCGQVLQGTWQSRSASAHW